MFTFGLQKKELKDNRRISKLIKLQQIEKEIEAVKIRYIPNTRLF